MTNDQRATLRLLLTGLAAAESLGSSSEFVPQSQIPALYAKLKAQGWPFKQVGGAAFNWRKGAPTDDSEMAMCLVRSFIELGRFDAGDVGKRFVTWMDSGPCDIGGTTARTLARLKKGEPWHTSGLNEYLKNPSNAANGSLMRNGVLPGIMFGEDLDLLFRATVQQSIITHYHPLPVLCCAAQSWIIADELSGWEEGPAHDSNWLDAFHEDWTRYVQGEDEPSVSAWLDRVGKALQPAGEALMDADWDPSTFNPFKTEFSGRAGYCLLTLQIGVWALHWSKMNDPFPVPAGFPAEVFERRGAWTIGWPALIGFDSDTYGAVAGPMIAAAHGSVPAEMTAELLAVAELEEILPQDHTNE
jgi:ADP-ribosylglycohydrolase